VLKEETQTTGSRATAGEPAWRCAACGKEIAADRDRIPLEGASTRAFVNPAGIEFVIAGFRDAPGCATQGEITSYWSWFPGFAWQIASCAGCGAHLGWRFSSEDERFYGLILDRLIAPNA
jgi:hypothetical protein